MGFHALGQACEKFALDTAEFRAANEAYGIQASLRLELARGGYAILRPILRRLFGMIEDAALGSVGQAELADRQHTWQRSIGSGELRCDFSNLDLATEAGKFERVSFDAPAFAIIWVFDRKSRITWSASLWYADLARRGTYRWYEIGYQSRSGSNHENSLHHLEPHQFYLLGPPESSEHFEAFAPRPIDDESAEEFIDRWAILTALALVGRLEPPPMAPIGNWWPQF